MPELHELSVAEAAAQIREGTLSPVALAESLLTRIDALDGDLRAWVTIDRDAVLSAAREREAEVQRGDPLGLIHGVPVGLKDIFYTEGMLTACGSKVNADFVPDFDATSVAKIKAAGGIILGKAVTTEFASGDPSPTRNPWNLEHTPGGSSSGSSAAVAARMVPAALGSQTGGSTCRPAGYNGIVGVKATYGRISRYGVAPLSWSLDHVGILTRTVADAALMLTVLSGADDNDPGSLREPVPDFSAQMVEHDRPPRIGLVRQYYQDYATPEIWAHTEAVAHQLAEAGAEVEEISLPDSFAVVHSFQRVVSNVECAGVHEANHRVRAADYGPRIRAGMEMGMIMPTSAYLKAQRLRRQFRADLSEMVDKVDVVMTPAIPAPAPPRDLNTTGDAAFQVPWTAAGLPTVVVSTGLSELGMPMAVQFAGPWAQEGRVLGAAQWCERIAGLNQAPPIG